MATLMISMISENSNHASHRFFFLFNAHSSRMIRLTRKSIKINNKWEYRIVFDFTDWVRFYIYKFCYKRQFNIELNMHTLAQIIQYAYGAGTACTRTHTFRRWVGFDSIRFKNNIHNCLQLWLKTIYSYDNFRDHSKNAKCENVNCLRSEN